MVSFGAGGKYEELEIPISPTRMILVHVMVAKVIKWERMLQILRAVPTVQNDPNWTCRIWVRDALANLATRCECLRDICY